MISQPCVFGKGDPLPEGVLVHRLGPCEPSNCVPKTDKRGRVETTCSVVNKTGKKEPGFSLLATYDETAPRDEAAKKAAQEFQLKYPSNKATVAGTASVAELRVEGFEVIHDPTGNLPNHASIYRPDGQWTEKEAKLLAGILKCTSIR